MSGKCDDQYQYKETIEDYMVSTPEGFTENNQMSYGPSVPVKQHNSREKLFQYREH